MDTLLPDAARISDRLRALRQTVAVSESSAGGLIAAALLAQPGASAFFRGGAVVYTRHAQSGLLGVGLADMQGVRSASEPYASLVAERVRERLRADWGLAETGAAGPSGNAYGDSAGHTCLAVAGSASAVRTLETGMSDRIANMRAFAAAALALLLETLPAE
jgi:PncC family amidohydrolase